MISPEELPFGDLHEATFERRPNRYLAHVIVNGTSVRVHVPDPGRMRELLVAGRKVYVRRAAASAKKRTTEWDLVLVNHDGVLVSINTQIPNRLVRRALEMRRLPAFAAYDRVRPEVSYGNSRLDFALSRGAARCFVEVKSVGWMREGIGWFPDAKTVRGRRHMEELADIRARGTDAAVVFVSQRGDVSAVSVDADVDQGFADAFDHARAAGVAAYAYRCAVTMTGVRLEREIPVRT